MAEVMFGEELHPDRVIPVEKLYELLNKYGVEYSFPVQHGIENSAFPVVRCKYCEKGHTELAPNDGVWCALWNHVFCEDGSCSYGERRNEA